MGSTRAATLADLPRLTDIYNHYVRETPITFDVDEWTVERRRSGWFEHYATTGRHQLRVLEDMGTVCGYASSSQFRQKAAYDTTVEISIYLAPDAKGHGYGTALYADLLQRLEEEDVHRALGGVTLPNPASIALHEKFGFQKVAHFTECGRKGGKYWDVIWLEKRMERT